MKNRSLYYFCEFKIFTVFLVSVILMSGCGFNTPHKSDKRLISNLQTGKAGLLRLLEMIEEDKTLEFVTLNHIRMKDSAKPQAPPISAERTAEYRKLIRESDLAEIRIFRDNETLKPGLVEFISSVNRYRQDTREHYSFKGYKWRPVSSITSDEPLDGYQRDAEFEGEKTRRIDENWTLMYHAHWRSLDTD